MLVQNPFNVTRNPRLGQGLLFAERIRSRQLAQMIAALRERGLYSEQGEKG
jgi:hypothetical protein